MSQVRLGPYNIGYGNSAFFTAEFFDADGRTTTPVSAVLSITYTNRSNIEQNDLVDLTPTGSFLTGTWSSTGAAPGLAPWTVTAAGFSSVAQQGIIRVYNP